MVHPSYRGELRPSPVDLNIKEKHGNHRCEVMWRIISAGVVMAFCGLVFVATYMWDFIFHGHVTLTGSIMLAVQIKLFELIFHSMAMCLTHYENHQFQQEWYDSFLWKKFAFYSVNSYYPFFYLTVIQGAVHGRNISFEWVRLLRLKLVVTIAVLTLFRIVEVVMAAVVLDLQMRWEDMQIRSKGIYAPGKEPDFARIWIRGTLGGLSRLRTAG